MAKLPKYFHFRVLGGATKIGLQDVSDHDFVEVVRCEDCREYDTTGYDDTPGFGWCECLHKDVQSCFYCAHGEKGANK